MYFVTASYTNTNALSPLPVSILRTRHLKPINIVVFRLSLNEIVQQ